jgi:hypothetical protein
MAVLDTSLPADTTAEEDRLSLGQRRINLIWETTQAVIAVSVSLATLVVSAVLSVRGGDTTAFLLMSNGFFRVIGFYFGRTNHTRVGGLSGKGDR